MKVKKWKVLKISNDILVKMFQVGQKPAYEVIENALPENTKIVEAHLDAKGNVSFLLESENFPEVEGDELYDDSHHPLLKPPVLKKITTMRLG